MKYILVVLVACVPLRLNAQGIMNPHDSTGYHCSAVIVDGDTIPVMYFDEVYVWGNKSFKNSAESRTWNRLVYNVKIAYPYAKLAGIKFNQYNTLLTGITNEKQKKALMEKAEREIEAQFGDELRELTITQGKILIKLIDRQTSNCSYDIVKEFRGRFRAFFYQTFARIFGYDLRTKYDPLGADADIERIVLMIENGSI